MSIWSVCRRWRPRFSLRGLVLFILWAASLLVLWLHWEPWVPYCAREADPSKTAGLEFLDFSSDQQRVISRTQEGTIRSWQFSTGEERTLFPSSQGQELLLKVFASPNGPLAATVGKDPAWPSSALLDEEASENGARSRLNFRTSVEFTDETIQDVVQSMGALPQLKEARVRLDLDSKMLADHPDFPRVSLKCNAMSFNEILHWVARLTDLTEVYEKSRIILMRREDYERNQAEISNRNVQLWDLSTGKPAGPITGCDSRIVDLKVFSEGRFLAAFTEDSRVWFAEVAGRRRISIWKYPEEAMSDTASISADGRCLAMACRGSNRVCIWNVADGAQRAEFTLPQYAFGTALSPNGDRLIACAADRLVRLWDVSSRTLLCTWESVPMEYENWIPCFSPDGTRILGHTVRYFEVELRDGKTGRPIPYEKEYPNGPYLFTWFQFSPDGYSYLGSKDGGVSGIWDARSGRLLSRWLHYSKNPDGDKIRRSGNWINEHLNPWFVGNSDPNPFANQRLDTASARFSQDGKRIVATDGMGSIQIFYRRRPEYGWGLCWLLEFWICLALGGAFMWNLKIKRCHARVKQAHK